MESRKILGGAIGAMVGAVWLVAPLAAFGELANWNQERVASYAAELKTATQALYDEIVRMPRDPKLNAEMYYQARDDVRTMNNSARFLAKALADGKGREETAPTFARIQTLRRDAEETGRNALIPDAVMARITPVGAALLKLRPYYEAEPPREATGTRGADAE